MVVLLVVLKTIVTVLEPRVVEIVEVIFVVNTNSDNSIKAHILHYFTILQPRSNFQQLRKKVSLYCTQTVLEANVRQSINIFVQCMLQFANAIREQKQNEKDYV